MEMIPYAVAAVAQSAMGEMQGSAANVQGDIAFGNAQATRQQGSAREDMQRRQNAMRMGDLRARSAESGFDPSSGSLATLQTKSAAEMELDALTTRYESDLRALSFENEGRAQRYNARVARRSGYLSAAATLAQAGSQSFFKPRIGPPAPVESRTPTPTGWVPRDW